MFQKSFHSAIKIFRGNFNLIYILPKRLTISNLNNTKTGYAIAKRQINPALRVSKSFGFTFALHNIWRICPVIQFLNEKYP